MITQLIPTTLFLYKKLERTWAIAVRRGFVINPSFF